MVEKFCPPPTHGAGRHGYRSVAGALALSVLSLVSIGRAFGTYGSDGAGISGSKLYRNKCTRTCTCHPYIQIFLSLSVRAIRAKALPVSI